MPVLLEAAGLYMLYLPCPQLYTPYLLFKTTSVTITRKKEVPDFNTPPLHHSTIPSAPVIRQKFLDTLPSCSHLTTLVVRVHAGSLSTCLGHAEYQVRVTNSLAFSANVALQIKFVHLFPDLPLLSLVRQFLVIEFNLRISGRAGAAAMDSSSATRAPPPPNLMLIPRI